MAVEMGNQTSNARTEVKLGHRCRCPWAVETPGSDPEAGGTTTPIFLRAGSRALLAAGVWQMACRLEEIPKPGDFVEYEILDQSIIVVRLDPRQCAGLPQCLPSIAE